MNIDNLLEAPGPEGLYAKPYLPEGLRQGMDLYLLHRVKPGSFLYAVLSNDLNDAVMRADHVNFRYLSNIVCWLSVNAPYESWGSPEAVQNWLKKDPEG